MRGIIFLSAIALINGGIIDYTANGCPKDYSIEKLLPHQDYTQYYQCLNGIRITRVCPAGLYFDSTREVCDWPQNTDCCNKIQDSIDKKSETIEDLDTSDPSQAPNICATTNSDGVLVAHENCNQFYKCFNGQPVAMLCGLNLLYNPNLKYCDWPQDVDCGDRVIPDPNDDNNEVNDQGSGENGGHELPEEDINDDPSKASEICAAENSNGVLVAHENCNQFYKCFNGQPVAMLCGLNLLYNPNLKYCDWPQDVDCGDRVIPDPNDDNNEVNDQGNGENGGQERPVEDINDDPSKASEICAAESSDGVLVAHENCNQFYKCFNGQPVAMLCGLNLLYNPNLKYCDWPQDVDCGDRVIPDPNNDNNEVNDQGNGDNGGHELPEEDINDDPSKASEICAAENSDGVLVAHENCNQFYKCFNGQPVAMLCGLNLLYNPNMKYCDWPQDVDCGDRVIPEPNDDNNEVNDQGNGANRGHELPEEDINDDPSKASEICAAENSNGILVAHENCNQFYKCFNGQPVAMLCGLNLLYNPNLKYCDWPQDVDCGDRVIPDPNNDNNEVNDQGNGDNGGHELPEEDINDDPSKASEICAAENSDGVLVAHENCNQFYKCFNGQPVAMLCGLNLLYNPNMKYCDWPQDVDCGDRVIPEPNDDNNEVNDQGNGANGGHELPGEDINDDPSKASEICAAESSDGVLVAHENCNQFYKCFNGQPVAMLCGLNLLYNPNLKYCDWPQDVDCGDRVIPDPNNDNNEVNDQGNGDNGGHELPEEDINDDPSKASEICAAENSDGVLVAHENCNQFYKCFNGQPVAMLCGLNLLYNPNMKYCDWPQDVDCGDRVIPEPNDDNNEVNDQGNGANGGHELPGEDINDDPSKASEICAAESSDGVLVAHENCNQFYKCFNGQPVAMLCGLNLLYNPNLKYCDWPQNVDCGNREIPEQNDDNSEVNDQENDGHELPEQDINDDPSKAPEICAVEGSDGILVAHEICSKFYKCSMGLPVTLVCYGNLLYNPSKRYCDWPQNVDCGERSLNDEESVDKNEETRDSNDDKTNFNIEATSICAILNSHGTQLSHENCDQFYKCTFGVPVAVSCPTGLVYNPRVQVCDWPTSVECGKRVKRIETQKRYLEAKKAYKFLMKFF